MKTTRLALFSVLVLSLMPLTGCTSNKPSAADLMRGYASDLQEKVDLKNKLADNHEKGTKLIASGQSKVNDGEDLVKESKDQLEKGQDYIKEGKQDITEGKRLIRESERQFRENFPKQSIKTGNNN